MEPEKGMGEERAGRWKGAAGERTGRKGKGLAGRRCFCWGFQSDFTNEMGKIYATERAGSNGHPVLCFLKPPPCGFSLSYRSFHK